jgi:hypothetical protein
MRWLLVTVGVAVLIIATTPYAYGAEPYEPGVVIVKFKDVLEGGGRNPLETQYPNINKLNGKYGVTRICPIFDFLPKEPVRHPQGKWEWRHWLAVMEKFRYDTYYHIDFDPRYDPKIVASAYKADPNVDLAEPNYYGYVFALYPHDPYMFPPYGRYFHQWNLDNDYGEYGYAGVDIDAPQAWEEYWYPFPPPVGFWPKVAIFDTGCVDRWDDETQYYHPDIVNWIDYDLSWDLVEGDDGPEDTCGHGTMVAGIVGGHTDNYFGNAALSWNVNRLGIIRVTPCHEVPFEDEAVSVAIVWAALNGADVLNFSLGQPIYSEFLHKACEGAYEMGVVMVAARGNMANDDLFYPASLPQCIAVTGLTPWNNLAPMSSWGWDTECTAPGFHIWSTTNTYACNCFEGAQFDIYFNWTDYPNPDVGGTSFAAAHVSATCAILVAACPFAYDPPAGLIEQWVRPILHASCVDIGPDGVDPYFGYGRLNLKNACDLAFFDAGDKKGSGGKTIAAAGPEAAASTNESIAAEERPSLRCYPNPASGPVNLGGFLASGNTAPVVELRVFDLSGRLVNEFTATVLGRNYGVCWDLTARDGSKVPSGVYVVAASAGRERHARKVVVTR